MPKPKAKQPMQRTPQGKEIPVPSRDQFFGDLGRATMKQPGEKPTKKIPGAKVSK